MADEIRTERLVLRRARAGDAKALHPIFSDAAAMRYWSTPPHAALAKTEAWVESMLKPEHPSDDFIVTLDGAVIGKLGCWKLPEVGYLLAPSTWGRGYASEAMRAYIAHRRGQGGTELTADVDPRNLASRRMLERCGFSEAGHAARTWEVGGEWCDSVYYRLEL